MTFINEWDDSAATDGILVDHGPVKPPYGTPEREAYDREHGTAS